MKEKICVLIATWFYSGLIPPFILKGMAGTYGSLATLPLCWAVMYFNPPLAPLFGLIAIIVSSFLGIWTVEIAETEIGIRKDWKGKEKSRDQNQIVIDEVLGMLITCYPVFLMYVSRPAVESLQHPWWALVVGFVLFRFFDIVKIWPTRIFDRMKSAFGVMMDDVIAGIYAAFFLWLIIRYTFL